MKLTSAAQKRLKELLPPEAAGFSVTGYVGTCRGSTPVLHPADKAEEGQEIVEGGGITFFVNADLAEVFRDCEMDYDSSLFGKGLSASWPHRKGCACNPG
jgi:Fe-S cluster assembly iron-binding protein IscA